MLTLTEKRQDTETREDIKSILECFNNNEAFKYWLNVLVKENKLSLARAGQILIEKGI